MHDLVVAMRAVADEARQAGVTEAKAAVDDQVKRLESDAERRREELRARADADIAGIGEWAAAEAERIKAEAEQRVVARRTQLDQQLSGETGRVEAESKSLRDRVSEYERELDAYHAQLGEISDPAAFAAAAKRMPRPPSLEARAAPVATPATTATASTRDHDRGRDSRPGAVRRHRTASRRPPPRSIRPRSRCLRAGWRSSTRRSPTRPATAAIPSGEPTTTEIVVSGLGSFGAITGFRQALAGVDGIDGVALSLGQTGEFIFRATHATGFDVGRSHRLARGRRGEGRATVGRRPARHARPPPLSARLLAHGADREEYPSIGHQRGLGHRLKARPGTRGRTSHASRPGPPDTAGHEATAR